MMGSTVTGFENELSENQRKSLKAQNKLYNVSIEDDYLTGNHFESNK